MPLEHSGPGRPEPQPGELPGWQGERAGPKHQINSAQSQKREGSEQGLEGSVGVCTVSAKTGRWEKV